MSEGKGPYRVEPEEIEPDLLGEGWVVADYSKDITVVLDDVYADLRDAESEAARLNSAFAAGLEQGRKERMDVAVLSGFEAGQKDYERYKKAWEEMSALIRLNSGMTPIEVDHIARKHGLEEK